MVCKLSFVLTIFSQNSGIAHEDILEILDMAF